MISSIDVVKIGSLENELDSQDRNKMKDELREKLTITIVILSSLKILLEILDKIIFYLN
jgi:hypothetical protein